MSDQAQNGRTGWNGFWPVVVVAFIVLLAIVGLLYAALGPENQGGRSPEQVGLIRDAARLIVQLITLGIIGVLIKQLVEDTAKAKEARAATRALRTDWLQRLRKIHQTIRSAPFTVESSRTVSTYQSAMAALLEARTDLMELGTEIEAEKPTLDPACFRDAKSGITHMIWYLSDLLREAARFTTAAGSADEDWANVTALAVYGDFREKALAFDTRNQGITYDSYERGYAGAKGALRRLVQTAH